MKTFQQFIEEKLIINKDYKKIGYDDNFEKVLSAHWLSLNTDNRHMQYSFKTEDCYDFLGNFLRPLLDTKYKEISVKSAKERININNRIKPTMIYIWGHKDFTYNFYIFGTPDYGTKNLNFHIIINSKSRKEVTINGYYGTVIPETVALIEKSNERYSLKQTQYEKVCRLFWEIKYSSIRQK